MRTVSRLEVVFERALFSSRWLLAPFYVGLVGALVMLLAHFAITFAHAVIELPGMDENDVVLMVLKLIDLSLAGNLLLIVIFAGYENFISRMHTIPESDRSAWMGEVDFSGLKIKLIGSIVAISAIHLLEVFLDIHGKDKTDVMWMVIVHLVFVTSGVVLAVMDRLAAGAAKH